MIFSWLSGASDPLAVRALATSTPASEPEAAKPMLVGKNESASPSHRNSSEPLGESASTVSIVHWKWPRSAVQWASESETTGRAPGLWWC